MLVGIRLEQPTHDYMYRLVAHDIAHTTQLINNKIIYIGEGNDIDSMIDIMQAVIGKSQDNIIYIVISNDNNELLHSPEPTHLVDFIKHEYDELIQQASADEYVDWHSIDHANDIDWTKVPIGTLVIVKDDEYSHSRRKQYVGVNYTSGFPYICFTDTDQTECDHNWAHKMSFWKFCKIHHSVNIKREWLK